jgi:hypothetical protein
MMQFKYLQILTFMTTFRAKSIEFRQEEAKAVLIISTIIIDILGKTQDW